MPVRLAARTDAPLSLVPAATEPDRRADRCRRFYRRMAAGVGVVTTTGPDGPIGMTASTVTAVSLEPPLLLVSLRPESQTLAAIRADGRFAVNLLASDQRRVADRFAAHHGAESFAGLRCSRAGTPVLLDALASAVCWLDRMIEAGDHVLVLGVVATSAVRGGTPLVWHRSGYAELATPHPVGQPRRLAG